MNTVEEFYDVVMLNEFHNILVKSLDTDDRIAYFTDPEGLRLSKCADKKIKHFATDWVNKVYILWV